jgi:excisionase family DNA binding protein
MPELLTKEDVARLFNIKPNTVYRWSKEGVLRPIRPTKRTTRFLKDEVLKLLKEMGAEQAA